LDFGRQPTERLLQHTVEDGFHDRAHGGEDRPQRELLDAAPSGAGRPLDEAAELASDAAK